MLNITRHFTKDKQTLEDVMNEVEWETTTVKIIGKNNETIFEQVVEFPIYFSENARKIVASKYLYGKLNSPEREYSLKQLIGRVVNKISKEGLERKYFSDYNTPKKLTVISRTEISFRLSENDYYLNKNSEYHIFRAELAYMLLHQMFAFNSPVWFSVGTAQPNTASACYVLGIEDNLESIFDHAKTEGLIFKGGSGVGVNLSTLRAEGEQISGGGTSSGVLSFDRIFEEVASSTKSGGRSRRAARLVCLDIDHPEIENFITCKSKEEKKAKILIENGYSDAIDGEAYSTVSFQNANHSVQISNEFMEAVKNDADWNLINRTDGKVAKTVRARYLWNLIAEQAHNCFVPNTKIFTKFLEKEIKDIKIGELVWTGAGMLKPVKNIIDSEYDGDIIRISTNKYTHIDVTPDHPILISDYKSKAQFVSAKDIKVGQYFHVPQIKKIDRLNYPLLDDEKQIMLAKILGYYLSEGCVTHDNRTKNRMQTLSFCFNNSEDHYIFETQFLLKNLFGVNAKIIRRKKLNSAVVQVSNTKLANFFFNMCGKEASGKYVSENVFNLIDTRNILFLVEYWFKGDGHYREINNGKRQLSGKTISEKLANDIRRILLVNNIKNSITSHSPKNKQHKIIYIITLFGNSISKLENKKYGLHRHQLKFKIKSIEKIPYKGKVYNLTIDSKDPTYLANMFIVHNCGDPGVQFSDIINEWNTCPSKGRIVSSNPCLPSWSSIIKYDGKFAHGIVVSLSQIKEGDKIWSQDGWTTITKVYDQGYKDVYRHTTENNKFFYATKDHRIISSGEKIPVEDSTHLEILSLPEDELVESSPVKIIGREKYGSEHVFDIEVDNQSHTFWCQGFNVSNCSEYLFLNFTSCNLGSFNLMKFYSDSIGPGNNTWYRQANKLFDVDTFLHSVKIAVIAMNILIDFADYPTEKIAQETRKYRTIGIGYSNLGALLMAHGLPYDSDEGRQLAGAITALMTAKAYSISDILCEMFGPYEGWDDHHHQIINKHIDHMNKEIEKASSKDIAIIYDLATNIIHPRGTQYRNAQVTVMAPTGTTSFMMDCDTTGCEPELSLVKYKSLVGGGTIKTINSTIKKALEKLGYTENDIGYIVQYVRQHGTIEDAEYEDGKGTKNIILKSKHLPIFDCSFKPQNGRRFLSPEAHVRMLAAIQNHVSGGISKTVNLPNNTTVEDIQKIYELAYKLGVKCIAVYRDGCKMSQPLTNKMEKKSVGPHIDKIDLNISRSNKKIESVGKNEMEEIEPSETNSPPRSMEEIVERQKVHHEIDKVLDEDKKLEKKIYKIINQAIEEFKKGECTDDTKMKVGNKKTRETLPDTRQSITHKCNISGQTFYITVGLYEDGRPGEVFISCNRHGSFARGTLDAIGIFISFALQYGAPIEDIIRKLKGITFAPNGITRNKEIPLTKSILDYLGLYLESEFGNKDVEFIVENEEDKEMIKNRYENLKKSMDKPKDLNFVTGVPPVEEKQIEEKQILEDIEKHTTPGYDTMLKPVNPEQTKAIIYTGQVCKKCGDLLVSTGRCYTCPTCGESSGGCG